MSTNAILGIIIGLLAIGAIGVGAYMLSTDTGEENGGETDTMMEGEENTQAANEQSGADGDMERIRTAIREGEGKMTCNYTTESQEGTIYIDGQNLATVSNTTQGKAHMVYKDETTYIWLEGGGDGMKMQTNVFKEAEQNVEQNQDMAEDMSDQYGFDYENPNHSYECRAGAPDASHFELPSDIQFTDLSSMMNQASQQGA